MINDNTVKRVESGWVTVRNDVESDCPFPTRESAEQSLADIIADDHDPEDDG